MYTLVDQAALRRLTVVPSGKITPGTYVRFICEAVVTNKAKSVVFEWIHWTKKKGSKKLKGRRIGVYTSFLILRVMKEHAGRMTCRLGSSTLETRIEFFGK